MAVRKPLDFGWRRQISDQGERYFSECVETNYSDAADLDEAGNGRRRAYQNSRSGAPQLGLVIGDKAGTTIYQAKGKIGFTCPRRPTEQQATAPDRDRGRVNQCGRCQRGACQRDAGSLTEKRAPIVTPPLSLRFSAQIMPRCASTICFEIESPSPECVPNCSPSGRSV
jgi:hypothetical protein